MLTAQTNRGGWRGNSNTYVTDDHEMAVIDPVKALAMTMIDLLADGAPKEKEVTAKAKPPMTIPEYL